MIIKQDNKAGEYKGVKTEKMTAYSIGKRKSHVFTGKVCPYEKGTVRVKPVAVERQRLTVERLEIRSNEPGKLLKSVKSLRTENVDLRHSREIDRSLKLVNGVLRSKEDIAAFKASRKKAKRSANKADRKAKKKLLKFNKSQTASGFNPVSCSN